MTSESPGDVDGVRNKHCNRNLLKKKTNVLSRDRSQCLYIGNKLAIPLAWPRLSLLVLTLTWLVALASAEGFCDPLLCSCQLSSANCSWRGLLSLPSGLHDNIKYLGKSDLLIYLRALLTELVDRSLQ